ncbi:cadmium resistance transporter [Sphaerospermopsis aphanizomenoides BCCUSP55]|uniref:cadmium resistance transporter n=1 Tax=Sphaerospermopsis aphanizomenoides TaxID=459663 RepID=UPI001905A0AA|nr:cadmium resistance transporter [Sphaerospermopsis aphanizomenoides]MBK1986296.1 cadmium resistance transporter [Sphaerospermopsis aphanizomenoides BCCUSP55]
MSSILTAIINGVVAFGATNIDDLVILLVFFAQINDDFRPWQIVLGQYIGFTILVILSLPGLLGGLILPANLIGLLGLVPLAIGISSLVNQETDSLPEVLAEITPSAKSKTQNFFNPQIYTITLITIANGSDNISIYITLFSSIRLDGFLVIITLFFILLAIWCYAAYKLTHQQKIAEVLTSYGNYLVPFVLMGLGAVIVWKSQALSPLKLLASCLCLLVLVKKASND